MPVRVYTVIAKNICQCWADSTQTKAGSALEQTANSRARLWEISEHCQGPCGGHDQGEKLLNPRPICLSVCLQR